jgi:hypothetical protein
MVARILLERDLERYFSAQCKKHKLMTLKLHVRFARGWPDRIVALENGEVLWVELKRPGGTLSALQEKVHADLARLGHSVHVTYSKEDIDRVLGTA